MPAAALRALLERAIDYAGLFPPASLALKPALENQAAYIRSPDRWMLGAFILPVAKFDETSGLLDRFEAAHPLRVSALGPKTDDASAFHEAIKKAASAIAQFPASVVQFEMPLPPRFEVDSLGNVEQSLGGLELDTFWEAPAEKAAETMAALRGKRAGFKLRTGGVTAAAFPSAAQIAAALVAASREKVAIKFTAGLHHPVRLFHESVGAKMFGFLNVLGAGVLAAEHGWDVAQTEQMLLDENDRSFAFDDEKFRWRDWEISAAQIRARRKLVTSLGSCSFDEPRDDLRSLGLF